MWKGVFLNVDVSKYLKEFGTSRWGKKIYFQSSLNTFQSLNHGTKDGSILRKVENVETQARKNVQDQASIDSPLANNEYWVKVVKNEQVP